MSKSSFSIIQPSCFNDPAIIQQARSNCMHSSRLVHVACQVMGCRGRRNPGCGRAEDSRRGARTSQLRRSTPTARGSQCSTLVADMVRRTDLRRNWCGTMPVESAAVFAGCEVPPEASGSQQASGSAGSGGWLTDLRRLWCAMHGCRVCRVVWRM